MPTSSNPQDFALIHTYTAEDAETDGILKNVGPAALEAGFTLPVLVTNKAWDAAISWTRPDGFQDESGRLWDMLNMCRRMIMIRGSHHPRIEFKLAAVPNQTPAGHPSKSYLPVMIRLAATVNAYDRSGNPCWVISLPDED